MSVQWAELASEPLPWCAVPAPHLVHGHERGAVEKLVLPHRLDHGHALLAHGTNEAGNVNFVLFLCSPKGAWDEGVVGENGVNGGCARTSQAKEEERRRHGRGR